MLSTKRATLDRAARGKLGERVLKPARACLTYLIRACHFDLLVREMGLEPTHLAVLDPKSSASTSSAILA